MEFRVLKRILMEFIHSDAGKQLVIDGGQFAEMKPGGLWTAMIFYIVLGCIMASSGQTNTHEPHSSHLSPIML
jgi:hypothetical protein